MDARTRERLPVLPVLVRSGRPAPQDSRGTPAGRPASRTRRHLHRRRPDADAVPPRPEHDAARPRSGRTEPPGGKRRDLWHEEEYAFWAWAAVEVLRLTGIRIEELLEIGHHSLVQYRLPTTGESSRSCRSLPPRPTPNGSSSSAPSLPTCSPPSSSGSANPLGSAPGPRLRLARMRMDATCPAAVPTPIPDREPLDQPRHPPQDAARPPSPAPAWSMPPTAAP